VWAGSFVYAHGPWRIGLCADDAELVEAAAAIVPGTLSPTTDPPSGYSLVAHPAEPPAGAPRELPSLRLGHNAVLRSRDPRRLALSLGHHLRSHPSSERRRARLHSAAVVADDRAVLLPTRMLWAAGLERRLERAGLEPYDSPTVELEGERAAVTPWSWPAGDSDPRADLDVPERLVDVAGWLLDPSGVIAHDMATGSGRLAAGCMQLDSSSEANPQLAITVVEALRPRMIPLEADLAAGETVEAVLAALAR
jgi:hypothetical protein